MLQQKGALQKLTSVISQILSSFSLLRPCPTHTAAHTHDTGMRPPGGATDDVEEDGTFTCRVCQRGSGTAGAGAGAVSKTSVALKLCSTCIRKDELRLADGSIVRFCFGHRRLEAVTSFKGKQSRCEAALAKLRASRKSAKEAKEAKEVVGGGGENESTIVDYILVLADSFSVFSLSATRSSTFFFFFFPLLVVAAAFEPKARLLPPRYSKGV